MGRIYLDHNATTPIRPEVLEAVTRCYHDTRANPASQHRSGQQAHRTLDEARERIAAVLGAELAGAKPDQVIFTSGGTEANNLAILGIAQARTGGRPGQLVVSAIEHPSVLEPAAHLLDLGWRVDTLGVDSNGVVRAEELPSLMSPQTALVSIMLGNHETGALQPVQDVAGACRFLGVPFHTDAVQVIGKLPVNFRTSGASAMSLAAHKFSGPSGIGALVLRADVPIWPLLFGGHQQGSLRPGTEPVALAVGMATALELSQKEQQHQARRVAALRRRFEESLKAELPCLVVNGVGADRLPNTSNLAFPGIDAQVLLLALDLAGVECSAGAACSSGSTELSPTLRAMGVPNEVLKSSLRFSLGADTTEAEVDEAVRRILHVVRQLS